jgi:hypothetical protein
MFVAVPPTESSTQTKGGVIRDNQYGIKTVPATS